MTDKQLIEIGRAAVLYFDSCVHEGIGWADYPNHKMPNPYMANHSDWNILVNKIMEGRGQTYTFAVRAGSEKEAREKIGKLGGIFYTARLSSW